jgi:putative chitinase
MSYDVLIKGKRSALVPTLKSWLNKLLDPSPGLSPDETFDQQTYEAVMKFQIAHALPHDGSVTADTWGALGKEIGTQDFGLEAIALLPPWLKKLVTGKPQVFGAMAFRPSTFFSMYMKEFGGMTQRQIDGLEQLLDFIESDPDVTDIRWATYMLATVKWECNDTWQPIEEQGKGAGHSYGAMLEVRDRSGRLWVRSYYGRGYVQLTHKYVYEKVDRELGLLGDLVAFPDKALDPELAYSIMSHGMRKGLYTGKKLRDYIYGTHCDYKNARRIINGPDSTGEPDQWKVIKGFAEKLEAILYASLGP